MCLPSTCLLQLIMRWRWVPLFPVQYPGRFAIAQTSHLAMQMAGKPMQSFNRAEVLSFSPGDGISVNVYCVEIYGQQRALKVGALCLCLKFRPFLWSE